MHVTLTRYPRPCPIPGHPQDDEPAPMVSDSAWTRLRAWHLHAPAERLPLPLALTVWPAAWILHAAHVPGHVAACAAIGAVAITWLTWRRHQRRLPRIRASPLPRRPWSPRRSAGGSPRPSCPGRLAGPRTCCRWIYLAGAIFGYRWLRGHPAVLAARKRRDDARRVDRPQGRMAPDRAP